MNTSAFVPVLLGITALVSVTSVMPLSAQSRAQAPPNDGGRGLSARLVPEALPLPLALQRHTAGSRLLAYQIQSAGGEQDVGLQQWQLSLEAAHSRRKSGINYVLIGAGVAVGSSLVGIYTLSAPIYVLGGLAGSGIFLYGVITWVSATDRIDELDREGRQKGYLK